MSILLPIRFHLILMKYLHYRIIIHQHHHATEKKLCCHLLFEGELIVTPNLQMKNLPVLDQQKLRFQISAPSTEIGGSILG